MSKNLLQDMIKTKRANMANSEKSMESFLEDLEYPVEKKSKKYYLWFVALFSVGLLFIAFSYLFASADVVINPKIKDLTLNKNLSASVDGDSSVLFFDLMALSGEETKEIEAVETKDVLQKSEGTVILYNTYSTTSQMLSIDTRLEGSNGKIYKTKNKLTVPGMAKDGKPGSVEVEIYASVPGPEYNSDPLDFKIFGFKGTPKYEKFYARSKGNISGGRQGKFPIISEEQKTNIISELRNSLKIKLLSKATEQIPGGFVLFKDAVFLDASNDNIDISSTKENVLSFKLKGTLYGFLFNETKLTKKIAEDSIEKNDISPVYVFNIRDLKFSLSGKDNVNYPDVKKIDFNLSGETKIVWKLDTDRLIADLLGKNKKEFNQILLKYPNIDFAGLVVSPVWRSSIPDKIKNINININYPK